MKYFGGVPILLEPQQFSGGTNTSELNLPRNKEAEVWDLIRSDLDFAAANLPATSAYGRANKYVALALESRAMLHAGSIAKFGTVQLDGIVGIDPAKANDYLKASYDASNEIIKSNVYSLFKKYTDKAQNFEQLFIELQGNPEAAARLSSYASQVAALRSAMDPVMQEPVPSRLNLTHIAAARRPRARAGFAPMAAAAMALSSVLVISNSLRLKGFEPQR